MTMLKILRNVFFAILCFASALHAGTFIVSGAGDPSVNGTYIENGTENGYPKYYMANGDNHYYIRYGKAGNPDGRPYCWEIMVFRNVTMNGGEIMSERLYTNLTISPQPPLTGWQINGGDSPAPSLQFDGPILTYTPDYFKESAGNDGSMSNSITITCDGKNGETFTGSNGDNFFTGNKASIANLPAGLTAVLTPHR
jgi:hypothetical protein